MKKQTKVWLVISIALCLALLVVGCSKADGPPPETSPTASKTHSGPTGTVTGVIAFNGTVPAAKKIDTSADPIGEGRQTS
jgi:hypothetical protein